MRRTSCGTMTSKAYRRRCVCFAREENAKPINASTTRAYERANTSSHIGIAKCLFAHLQGEIRNISRVLHSLLILQSLGNNTLCIYITVLQWRTYHMNYLTFAHIINSSQTKSQTRIKSGIHQKDINSQTKTVTSPTTVYDSLYGSGIIDCDMSIFLLLTFSLYVPRL